MVLSLVGFAPKEKAPKKRRVTRRTRKHPGISLIKPDSASGNGWRARYVDPDTGKVRKVTLDPTLTTAEQREAWAISKSKMLAKRRLELEMGATRASGTKVSEAVAQFFRVRELREKTRTVYRDTTDKFEAWAEREGLTTTDELTRAKLIAFRESIVCATKKTPARERPRGARQLAAQKRSPHTINRELRVARTVMGYLHEKDLLPKVSYDDLRRAFKRERAPVQRKDFLQPEECVGLLEAALRHDAATFAETRDEHRGEGPKGGTPRYAPIAPFIAFVLLAGTRFGEAEALAWSRVEVDARESQTGHCVGRIDLRAEDVKTGKARKINLGVAPSLRLLLALLRRSGDERGRVFGYLTRGQLHAAARRLRDEFGAPARFNWQILRRTCGTYLANAPNIFGAASQFLTARQLGHAVPVGDAHYYGEVYVPRDARTLERAMGVIGAMTRVVSQASKTQ